MRNAKSINLKILESQWESFQIEDRLLFRIWESVDGHTNHVWIQRSVACNASKGPSTRSRAKMQVYSVGSPFERVAMDIAGPFPAIEQGNRYILVVGDYFSKWIETYPLPNQEAVTVATALVHHWILRFGVPLELHSDQGSNFKSKVFAQVA